MNGVVLFLVVFVSVCVCMELSLPAGNTLASDTSFLSLPVETTARAKQIARQDDLRRENELIEAQMVLSRKGKLNRLRREEDKVTGKMLRTADLMLMQRLGTEDLGKGSVGGSLVSNLLGSSIKRRSDRSYGTVFNDLKRKVWNERHQVLIEEQEMASIRLHNAGAAAAAPALPAETFGSFVFNRSAVVNGTFSYNGTLYNVTDFPRREPPLRSLIPLLRFFDAEHKDHICNTDPYEFSDRQGAFQFQGIVAFIYSRRITRDQETDKDDDLVPFFRYWNKEHWPASSDHFFSLDPNLKGANLVRQGIVGFIYADPQPSLVALNEFFSAQSKSHLYSVSTDKSLKINGDTYEFKGVLGYVQPLDALERRKAELEQKRLAEEEKKGKVEEVVKVPEPQPVKKTNDKKWHPGQPLFVENQDWSH